MRKLCYVKSNWHSSYCVNTGLSVFMSVEKGFLSLDIHCMKERKEIDKTRIVPRTN